MSSPTCTPYTAALTVTLVPGFQYAFGRQCAAWSENQCQAPATAGLVVTVSAFSAAALSAIGSSKRTGTGCPMPPVRGPSGPGKRYGIVKVRGSTVLNLVVDLVDLPSVLAASALTE